MASLPTSLTEEQIAHANRLEGIFMPRTRRLRERRFDNLPADRLPRFVHYTSGEVALKIIKSKRVWTRNTTCMVDYREVDHGFDLFNKFFRDDGNRQRFTDALNLCAPGAADEAINIFNAWLPDMRLNTYVASMSEHDDREDLNGRLSMWRAFGGGGGRVAIVLRIRRYSSAAAAMNVMFSPVCYWESDTDVEDDLNSVIANVYKYGDFLKSIDRQHIINVVFYMLVSGVVCSKHPGFLEEREWRAIYSPLRSSSPLVEQSIETINGIPQIVYHLPLDAAKSPLLEDLDLLTMLDRIIIGPSPYPWVMYQAFVEALRAAGVADAESRVWTSNIPLRA